MGRINITLTKCIVINIANIEVLNENKKFSRTKSSSNFNMLYSNVKYLFYCLYRSMVYAKIKKRFNLGGWQWKFLLCLIPGLIFLMLGLSFVSEKLEILIVYLSCCIWAVSMLLFRYKIK